MEPQGSHRTSPAATVVSRPRARRSAGKVCRSGASRFDVQRNELQAPSSKLRAASYKSRATSRELRVTRARRSSDLEVDARVRVARVGVRVRVEVAKVAGLEEEEPGGTENSSAVKW